MSLRFSSKEALVDWLRGDGKDVLDEAVTDEPPRVLAVSYGGRVELFGDLVRLLVVQGVDVSSKEGELLAEQFLVNSIPTSWEEMLVPGRATRSYAGYLGTIETISNPPSKILGNNLLKDVLNTLSGLQAKGTSPTIVENDNHS